ncbi:MAG TPA: hypothetical protein ENJ09_03770 [Planctomycetes bacterium]|nr:hypothetical protein [Planctomycetota bacterium]
MRIHSKDRFRAVVALLGLALAGQSSASAQGPTPTAPEGRGSQETAPEESGGEELPPSVEGTGESAPVLDLESDPQQEMIDLFHRVERRLGEIDLDLADAGAGDLPPGELEGAGLEEFLKQTLAKSTEVQQDIERILELAQEMSQGGGGGGSSPPPPQDGESPLDTSPDNGPQGRENTPEAPGSDDREKDGTEKQDSPQGTEPGQGEEPGADQDNPDSSDPSNRRGQDPRAPRGQGGRAGDDAEQWGFLPARVREVFRNPGSRDLPVQYRDWIDTYYRRLNRSGSGS